MRQAYDYWQDQPGLSDATGTRAAPWDHSAARLSSKSAFVHNCRQQLEAKHCLTRGTYNLTLEQTSPKHSQVAECRSISRQLTHRNCMSSSNTQYPESINDHKDTHRTAPERTAIVPMPVPVPTDARSQARLAAKLAICQISVVLTQETHCENGLES